MAEIKVGDWVVRNKYPSKYLTPEKAYRVAAVLFDTSYSSNLKISLEGVETQPNGSPRFFDPEFFIVVEGGEPQWEVGAKVKCTKAASMGDSWPNNAAKIGETYTIAAVVSNGTHIQLEETPFHYKKNDFELVAPEGFVQKPKPKVVIYNKQA